MQAIVLAMALGTDPATLAKWLKAGDARAARITGVVRASDVRLEFVKLDEDAEEEAVLRFEGERKAEAWILDRGPAGWMAVGKFVDWWNYNSAHLDRLVELVAVTRNGAKDVWIRLHSGGTEEDYIEGELWQLREGKLVSILKVTEYSSKMEHPSGNVVTTTTRVDFPVQGLVVIRPPEGCRAQRWNGNQLESTSCP